MDDLDFNDGVVLRPLARADLSVLREATLLNMNWSEERFSEKDISDDPHTSHYTALDPERGDFGFLLTDSDGWVSVVWLLFLGRDDPGYGYVREGVPEVSICTAPQHRGRGYGRSLLVHAVESARNRGLHAISLSVEKGNPARTFYERLGFVSVPEAQCEGTMILELSPVG